MAALRHGVGRVRREVHEHLLELHGIDSHGAQVLAGSKTEVDVLSDQPRKRFGNRADYRIQFHHAQLLRLFPAKGEQLTGQFSGAPCRLQDLLNLAFQWTIMRNRIESEFRVARDNGQQIVEVVSNPAGQAADGVHFLRLQQLRFEPESLRQIAAVRYEVRDLPVHVPYRTDALLNVVQLTVLLAIHQDPTKHTPAENRLPHFLINLRTLLP